MDAVIAVSPQLTNGDLDLKSSPRHAMVAVRFPVEATCKLSNGSSENGKLHLQAADPEKPSTARAVSSRIAEKAHRLIDLGGLKVSPERRAEILKEIREGGEAGFFHVKNVGVSEEVIDRMRTLAVHFYSLTEEERLNLSDKPQFRDRKSGFGLGYTSKFSGASDKVKQHRQILRFQVYPKDRRADNAWPTDELRDVVMEYHEGIYAASLFIAGLLSEALGLPSSYIVDRMGKEPHMQGLLINTPGQVVEPGQKRMPGLDAHTDITFFNLLLHNHTKGLQFFIDEQWVLMPILDPHAICVNIGDSMETISNGRYLSAPHRVLPGSKDRLSILTLFQPTPETTLAPGPGLITEEYPERYRSRTLQERINTFSKSGTRRSDLTKLYMFLKPEFLDKSKNIDCVEDQLIVNGTPIDLYEVDPVLLG